MLNFLIYLRMILILLVVTISVPTTLGQAEASGEVERITKLESPLRIGIFTDNQPGMTYLLIDWNEDFSMRRWGARSNIEENRPIINISMIELAPGYVFNDRLDLNEDVIRQIKLFSDQGITNIRKITGPSSFGDARILRFNSIGRDCFTLERMIGSTGHELKFEGDLSVFGFICEAVGREFDNQLIEKALSAIEIVDLSGGS